jgi:hypothetical protein
MSAFRKNARTRTALLQMGIPDKQVKIAPELGLQRS